MKTVQTIFAFTISLILLTACASNPLEAASAPETSVPATEAPATVASPTSADEAETAPMPVAPDAENPGLQEEQSVLPVFSQPITATGEPLVLYGHLLDANSNPLNGYAVEIWQVDAGQLGPAGEMLLLDLNDAQDANGNQMKLAFKDIVVDAGTGGTMTQTPSQVEGPYYPVVDVSQFDNDLASIE